MSRSWLIDVLRTRETACGLIASALLLAGCASSVNTANRTRTSADSPATTPTPTAATAATLTPTTTVTPTTATVTPGPPTATTATPRTALPATKTTTRPAGTPGAIHLDETANGTTVAVSVGEQIIVTLASTYWTFGPPQPPVLQADSQPSTSPSPGCIPGGGCGTVTAAFTVASTGTATIAASRTSCGEALRCGPGRGSYQVTIRTNN